MTCCDERRDSLPWHENEKTKNTDRELTVLMNQLPVGTPDHFKTVITSMTRYNPPERASLATVRQIMGLDDDTRYHYFILLKISEFSR